MGAGAGAGSDGAELRVCAVRGRRGSAPGLGLLRDDRGLKGGRHPGGCWEAEPRFVAGGAGEAFPKCPGSGVWEETPRGGGRCCRMARGGPGRPALSGRQAGGRAGRSGCLAAHLGEGALPELGSSPPGLCLPHSVSPALVPGPRSGLLPTALPASGTLLPTGVGRAAPQGASCPAALVRERAAVVAWQ